MKWTECKLSMPNNNAVVDVKFITGHIMRAEYVNGNFYEVCENSNMGGSELKKSSIVAWSNANMPNIKEMTVEEYAKLRGITKGAVSQSMKDDNLPPAVTKIDKPTTYILHVDIDELNRLKK